MSASLLVEVMVAILLAVTIGYCVRLDRRLGQFRAEEQTMRSTIMELKLASERADSSVSGLKITAAEAERGLGEQLKVAADHTTTLMAKSRDADDILQRIAQIVSSSRMLAEAQAEASAYAEREALQRDARRIEALRAEQTIAADRMDRLSGAASAARALSMKARDAKMMEAA